MYDNYEIDLKDPLMVFKCKHEDEAHTLWYWVSDPLDGFPSLYIMMFDNRDDAMEGADRLNAYPKNELRWIKVFRSDNESYTCYFWENDEEYVEPKPLEREVRSNISVKRPWWRRLNG